MTNTQHNTNDITRTRAATIIGYGGSRPQEVSVPRWNAIVKQINNNGV